MADTVKAAITSCSSDKGQDVIISLQTSPQLSWEPEPEPGGFDSIRDTGVCLSFEDKHDQARFDTPGADACSQPVLNYDNTFLTMPTPLSFIENTQRDKIASMS